MTGAARPPRLALSGLDKRYGARRALAAVTLELAAGTIHGVLGENGAGKSTLVRIVAGALRPDTGSVAIDGTPLPLGAPRAARAAGVGVVFQHFALIGALSVAENLSLGRPETHSTRAWLTSPARLAAAASSLAERHGLAIGDPGARVDTLPVGTRARLEILRALSGPVKVLLLDEPTAVLTPVETAELFTTLRGLRDRGVLVVLITHKLAEALDVCDRVSVMRGGALVTTVATRDLSPATLAHLMIGDAGAPASGALATIAGTASAATAPTATSTRAAARALDAATPTRVAALIVHALSTPGAPGRTALHDVALAVEAGEICGVAGVDGNGQDELVAALYGLIPRGGVARVAGVVVPAGDVLAAQRAGVALIPGDRRREGLAPGLSLWENALLSRPLLARVAPHGVLDVGAARRAAAEIATRYRIVHARLDQPIADLSGGNQQRVVVGRALAALPRLLVAVNPTRGLDIAATAQVQATLTGVAGAGAAVLLISTDLDELRTLCARLFVLYRGRLHGPVAPDDRARLAALMAGLAA
ncbi:MAG: ATP-binding cassette domain-containing protein [Deltaproteobacteria bacterium]|nr:ATP-binding cassette domain-containing protein [Deltaproteobacteria bacterium]